MEKLGGENYDGNGEGWTITTTTFGLVKVKMKEGYFDLRNRFSQNAGEGLIIVRGPYNNVFINATNMESYYGLEGSIVEFYHTDPESLVALDMSRLSIYNVAFTDAANTSTATYDLSLNRIAAVYLDVFNELLQEAGSQMTIKLWSHWFYLSFFGDDNYIEQVLKNPLRERLQCANVFFEKDAGYQSDQGASSSITRYAINDDGDMMVLAVASVNDDPNNYQDISINNSEFGNDAIKGTFKALYARFGDFFTINDQTNLEEIIFKESIIGDEVNGGRQFIANNNANLRLIDGSDSKLSVLQGNAYFRLWYNPKLERISFADTALVRFYARDNDVLQEIDMPINYTDDRTIELRINNHPLLEKVKSIQTTYAGGYQNNNGVCIVSNNPLLATIGNTVGTADFSGLDFDVDISDPSDTGYPQFSLSQMACDTLLFSNTTNLGKGDFVISYLPNLTGVLDLSNVRIHNEFGNGYLYLFELPLVTGVTPFKAGSYSVRSQILFRNMDSMPDNFDYDFANVEFGFRSYNFFFNIEGKIRNMLNVNGELRRLNYRGNGMSGVLDWSGCQWVSRYNDDGNSNANYIITEGDLEITVADTSDVVADDFTVIKNSGGTFTVKNVSGTTLVAI
ncbi:hypothetical protein V6R21_11755 [Limibacter armeniacum]|uniref:hypothetical protein n=1 Tax=Limibacter armeniacum TaxID=466084 RepID=UPI002FE67F42